MTNTSKNLIDQWKLIKEGDLQAFESLYRASIQSLILYGKKVSKNEGIVKDAIQDLFSELWAKRSNLAEVQNVQFYLLKALKYKLLRKLSKNIDSYTIEDLFEEIPIDAFSEKEYSNDQQKILKGLIANLPHRQQEILHLKYFEGLSNIEIGELMDVNPQSVSNNLFRALSQLRKYKKQLLQF